MRDQAMAHFQKADPVLHGVWLQLIKAEKPEIEVTGRPPEEFFVDLCEAIIGQQLSGKAAQTIWGRFAKLFPDQVVTPERVLAISDDAIRATGPSWSKISYVKNLATAVKSGQLDLLSFPEASNEDIITQLTAIKGIGQWTAEMFLMFGLGRSDVFSFGDLGLRNGIAKWYSIDTTDKKALQKLSEVWSPYRTFAARVLWRSLELP